MCTLIIAAAILFAPLAQAEVEAVSTEFVPADIATHFNMTVKNDTATPVARVEYDAEFVTEGRAVPWGEITYAVDVPGGIEPGETRTLKVLRAPENLRYVEGYDVGVTIRQLLAFDMDGNAIN